MSKPITDSEIKDLRAMLEIETSGEWKATENAVDTCCWDAHVESVERDGMFKNRPDTKDKFPEVQVADVNSLERAEFIAAIRNAIPKLLDEVEATRKALREFSKVETLAEPIRNQVSYGC